MHVSLELDMSDAGYLTGHHTIVGGLIWVLSSQWPIEF